MTPALLDAMLRKVRPDYVQCDCKGHPGISSYPTRVGTPAPGFVRDPLRIWRDATARRGVGLYMHYSGVFDTAALKGHPDWALLERVPGFTLPLRLLTPVRSASSTAPGATLAPGSSVVP